MNISNIVVPIITPFKENGRVYKQGMENLIQFLYEKGIRSIWINGSYGSFVLMSDEDRMKTVEIALTMAKKLSMTTIVQIGSPST